jgi:serine O-acetyltransferase
MSFKQLRFLIRSDLWRHGGRASVRALFRHLLLTPGFAYTFWLRWCTYLRQHPVLRFGGYHLGKLILRHYSIKYGIAISDRTQVGSGLYIGHFGGIVVNDRAVIGRNCNLSHGVTLGKANRGPRQGYPVVGDDVYLAPGSKVVGNVRIGNGVAVGANCVVTKDVPDGAVVAGIPGRVISQQGSEGYVTFTDY